jgi:hypothetical protein
MQARFLPFDESGAMSDPNRNPRFAARRAIRHYGIGGGVSLTFNVSQSSLSTFAH